MWAAQSHALLMASGAVGGRIAEVVEWGLAFGNARVRCAPQRRRAGAAGMNVMQETRSDPNSSARSHDSGYGRRVQRCVREESEAWEDNGTSNGRREAKK